MKKVKNELICQILRLSLIVLLNMLAKLILAMK
jgi:hypothetical protein